MELKQYDLLWILLLVDVGINVAGIFISVIFKVRGSDKVYLICC